MQGVTAASGSNDYRKVSLSHFVL